MSYGLINSGRNFKNESMQGLSDVSKLEQQREMTNDSLASAKKAGEMSSMGTGAVSGAMIGSSVGAGAAAGAGGAAAGATAGAQAGSVVPGLGTIIGAGVGLLAGYLLS